MYYNKDKKISYYLIKMVKKLLQTNILILVSLIGSAQSLLINEVLTKNENTYSTISGETPDMIELYNSSTETIDLRGYYLSDDPLSRFKWSFKNGSINGLEHLVLAASGDSYDSLQGFETMVSDISPLGYDYQDSDHAEFPGTSTVIYTIFADKTTGNLNGFPVMGAKFFYGTPGALGYSYVGAFMRFDSWSTNIDRSNFETFKLNMYLEKDKKVKILFGQTGIEAWRNYGVELIGQGDTSWYEIPVKGVDTGLLDLTILEGFQIEGAGNYGDTTEFMIFDAQFVTTKSERFSTDFKLSSSGDALYLSAPDSSLVDVITIPALLADYSYGRETDGADEWTIFNTPTLSGSNGGNTISGFCEKEINYSITSGFYSDDQSIILSGSTEIRYTLDGSEPTGISTQYTAPILLDTTTVIKAACFEANQVPTQVFTNTYFIGYDTELPVWSVSTHPGNFFDADTGIYVLGPNVGPTDPSPYFNANFWKDWERPVHVEFFEDDGNKQFDIDCGIKVFGNFSKANDKKSLALFFRGKYGVSKLEYPLFPDYPGLSSFDDLILRGGGNDASLLHFRDGFHQTLIKDANFETQKYRPSVLFINGEYWGIYNIREKSNADFFVENYDIPKDDIDLISGFYQLRQGDLEPFENFMTAVGNGELSYTEIADFIDINSFIDYFSYEIYIANYDWPGNNIKYWRQRSTQSKWRWFMYDTDMSTGIYGQANTHYTFNAINKAIVSPPGTQWPNPEGSTRLLRKLIEFPEFKILFVNRYCDLMNTTLKPDHVLEQLQSVVIDKIGNEVTPNRERWGLDVGSWDTQLEAYKDFWINRPGYARTNMKDELVLDDSCSLSISISPAEAGYIKLNTIEVDDETWSGIYFQGIPVNIEAVANPGYSFTDWTTSSTNVSDKTSPKIVNLLLDENNTFVANFTGSKIEQLVTISEINYHSPSDLNTQDWVEIHNYGTDDVNLSNWSIRDEKLYNSFTIPEGTIIGTGEYLVLAEDTLSYTTNHPSFKRSVGPMGFSLSNSGERIQLLNNREEIVSSVTYSDDPTLGWPIYADGNGGTLELIDAEQDATSIASDWTSLCFGGSPSVEYNPSCPLNLVAIDDFVKKHSYFVSPNPVTDKASLEDQLFEQANIFRIYSLDGRLISEMEPSSEIDVSYLDKGLYILKVITETNEEISIRFVKEE